MADYHVVRQHDKPQSLTRSDLFPKKPGIRVLPYRSYKKNSGGLAFQKLLTLCALQAAVS